MAVQVVVVGEASPLVVMEQVVGVGANIIMVTGTLVLIRQTMEQTIHLVQVLGPEDKDIHQEVQELVELVVLPEGAEVEEMLELLLLVVLEGREAVGK